MTPSAKLGTRIAVAAIIASAAALAATTLATGASGTAKVTPLAESLSSPRGVAVDGAGNIAIADTGNCRVRYIPNVDMTAFGLTMRAHHTYTIAGSTCGWSGDRGPALRARLSFPADVAFDPAGDVYVADTGNSEVRQIFSKTGDIDPIAGTGTAGYSNDTGLGSAAALDGPSGIAVDAHGDLFIADTNNCRVREVPTRDGISDRAPIGGDIYTVAGDGTCGSPTTGVAATSATLRNPADVAVDARGNLLIADAGNRVVREVAALAGTNFGIAMKPGAIYTIAGSGTYNVYFGDGLPAASDASSVSFPNSIALDAAGNLYIADTYARAVREVPAVAGTAFGISTQPDAVFTIAGAGPTGSPTAGGTAHDGVVYPAGIAVDPAGNVYVADVGNNAVERLSAAAG